MKRPNPVRSRAAVHAAFTLVEIMMAVALSLLLLAAVITMFGKVSESISDSRSLLEMADRLRLAEERLQLDLSGVTVTMNPPRNPANNEGYFEIIEGPIGSGASMTSPSSVAKNTDLPGTPSDSSVGDFDDILMFTTGSTGQPFVGRGGQSYVAEVAWFVRGRTLHRRVLLVIPGAVNGETAAGFYASKDISVHPTFAANGTLDGKVTSNTLADLTRRECRFAHSPQFPNGGWNYWGWTTQGKTLPTLPTLYECSEYNKSATGVITYTWHPGIAPTAFSPSVPTVTNLDFWTNQANGRLSEDAFHSGTFSDRVSDDIILTNVIGFDVKVWDRRANSGRGAYVDLGYNSPASGSPISDFSSCGDTNSPLASQSPQASNYPRIYDTYSNTYFGTAWNDGLDNGGVSGIVDDDFEKTNPPPYPYPLRGIQVKIRCFEPDSRQVREVTVVQDFLPK
jgi:hypothetical protein